MRKNLLKSLLLRVLIYLVVVPLAVFTIVPNSFDTFGLIVRGQITLADVAPRLVDAFKKPPARPAVTVPDDIADVEDLGDGNYALAVHNWSSKLSGAGLQQQLTDIAKRFCAQSKGTPDISHSSNYNSHGYNDADLKFRCNVDTRDDPASPLHALEVRRKQLHRHAQSLLDPMNEFRQQVQDWRRELGTLEVVASRVGARPESERIQSMQRTLEDYEKLIRELTAERYGASPVPPVTAVAPTPHAPAGAGPSMRVVVAFNSLASGPDPQIVRRLDAFLARQEQQLGGRIASTRAHWGREGEFSVCLPLTEFDAARQAGFVNELRAALAGSDRASVAENAACPRERRL